MKTKMIIKRAALLSMMLGMAALNAVAETYIWYPANFANGTWNATDDTVWLGTLPNGIPTSADHVQFSVDPVVSATVTLSGAQSVSTLTVTQAGYRFAGDALTVTTGTFGASATFDNRYNSNAFNFSAANVALTFNGGGVIFSGDNNKGNVATASVTFAKGTFSVANASQIKLGHVANGTGGWFITDNAIVATAGNNQNIQINSANGTILKIDNGGSLSLPGTGELRADSAYITVGASGTLKVGGKLDLGRGYNTRLDVLNGGYVSTDSLNIGNLNNAAQTAAVNIYGGSVQARLIALGLTYGQNGTAGTASLNLSGGRLNVGTGGIIFTGVNDMKYNINLSGGTLASTGTWSSALNMTLDNTDGGVTLDTTGGNVILSGVLDGSGGFTKAGNGTLLLSGANTYEGNTIVSVGTLQLDNVDALGGVADLSVWAGATVNLNYSGVAVIDSLLLDGVTISNLVIGQNYNYNDLNSALGAAIFSGGGLLSISTIPEPSTWALLLTGAALLALFRRRRYLER